jgi:alpha-beta hydrolase superfamily lysophospholipase
MHHGLGGSRAQTLSRAVLLVRAGYRCVAFDHRAHGESEGRWTSFGFQEARDVAAALAFVRQRWPGEPCAMLGLSMGGAAVCFAAEQVRGTQAVILEGVYHDIASAFTRRLATMYPLWFRPLVHGIIWITQLRLGVRMADVAPAKYIGGIAPAPILLVTGTEDPHAGPNEAQRLQSRCSGPIELWLVAGARHGDVLEVAGEEYSMRLTGFLEKHLTKV